MKRKKLNFSLPANMHDFTTDEKDTRFSRGKLNIFYKGTTADGRYFSDEFAEAVVKTAAYAPVVGYYDREKDDFVGHASEQAIYGIVDPKCEPAFETMEDGNVWAICDVVLYTERPGEVGEIAKKIVGHSQSLELNPSTVKYKINYDEKKHFKNMEFTEGEIIGVSVLGDDQRPAFTGSGFFSNSNFEEKMKLLREYCDNSTNINDNVEKGGGEMNSDFMELSWGDISEKVSSAIMQEYGEEGYPILLDAFDEHVVFVMYYYMGGKKYLDIQYTCTENGEVTLGDVVEVRPTYVPIEQASEPSQIFEDPTDVNPENQVNPEEVVEQTPTEDFDTPEEGQSEPEVVEDVQIEPTPEQTIGDPAQAQVQSEEVSNAEEIPADDNQEQTPDSQVQESSSAYSVNENETKTKEESSASTFTDSEQEELKNNQRKQKIELINEYKDALTSEQFTEFVSKVDEYEFADLTVELLRVYKNSQNTIIRGFCNPMVNNDSTQDKTDDLGHIVAKVLNK